jgi:hypothetical protein
MANININIKHGGTLLKIVSGLRKVTIQSGIKHIIIAL